MPKGRGFNFRILVVDDDPMVFVRSSGTGFLWGKERLEPLPLLITEFMSCHTSAYGEFADTP